MQLLSLAENLRGQLVDWYEDVQNQARNLCAPYDLAGTLSLVAVPRVWEDFPGNINNPAEVAAGTHALDYRARPTYARPANFANNAATAVIAVNKRDLDKHNAYTTAISTLNLALLASVEADNANLLLHSTLYLRYFPASKPNMRL